MTAAQPPATYVCDTCSQTFTSDRKAERHVNTEHGGGKYHIQLALPLEEKS